MTNITKLFRELRKDGISAKQRAACCRSCTPSEVQVSTTMQSDWRQPASWYGNDPSYASTIYYDHEVAPKILLAAARVGIAIEWDGDPMHGMIVREEDNR